MNRSHRSGNFSYGGLSFLAHPKGKPSIRKHTRGSRALQHVLTNIPINSKTQGASDLTKARALNPELKFYFYPDIKAQLDREICPNEPHENRFEFDFTHIKT